MAARERSGAGPLATAYLLYVRSVRPWVLRTVPVSPAPAGVPWPVPDFVRNLQPAFLVAHVAIALSLVWPAQTVETRTATLLYTTVLWAGSGYLFKRLTCLYEHLTVWTAVLAVATFEWTTRSAWFSLPLVGLGAMALAYEALIRPRILPIEDAERWTLAWVARESSRLSPALLVGHALPLLAVAWPWQTADSRYLTLAAVAVASAAAVRLYPARALAYEWIAVGFAAVAVVLALFETALTREWIGVAVVGFVAALLLAARGGGDRPGGGRRRRALGRSRLQPRPRDHRVHRGSAGGARRVHRASRARALRGGNRAHRA